MAELVAVRNKTGEARRIATLGEEGFPVHRLIDDDDTLDLPAHLADRLCEQPGWEAVGDLAAPKKAKAGTTDTPKEA